MTAKQSTEVGAYAVKPTARPTSAFTMIEIIVVISLIAVLVVIAVPQLNVIAGTDNPTRVNRLAADVRAAFDMAVLIGKPFRLVFNLASGDYHLEEADRREFFLGDEKQPHDLTEEEEKQLLEQFDVEFGEYVDLAGETIRDPETDEDVGVSSPVVEAKAKLAPVRWTPVENLEWRKRALGPNLIVKEIHAEHHASPQKLEELGEQGRAMIYFFPSGYVEKAVVVIGLRKGAMEVDETKPPYNVVTNPYQGTADVSSGALETDIFEDMGR